MIQLPLKYAVPLGIGITLFLMFLFYLGHKRKTQKALEQEVKNAETKKVETEGEYQLKHPVNPRTWIVLIFAIGLVMSVMGLVISSLVPGLIAVMCIIGIFGLIIVGIPMGGLLFKKEIVCKIMKFISKKNYGIVVIVAGKNMIDMIKNLDKDYLKINDRLFIIQKNRIYYADGTTSKPIEESAIKFSAGVPMIFLDVNSLTPLAFNKDDLKITPEEISAPLKAYAIITEAEFMQYKKKLTLSVIGIIILLVFDLGLAYGAFSYSKTAANVCNALNGKLDSLIAKATTNVVTQGA